MGGWSDSDFNGREISFPVRFPETTDVLYINMFTRVNRALNAWGYVEDPRLDFARRVRAESNDLSGDPDGLRKWAEDKERWIVEGDRILKQIEYILCSDLMDTAGSMHLQQVRRKAHRTFVHTALTMQYMTVVVEFVLDELNVSNPE